MAQRRTLLMLVAMVVAIVGALVGYKMIQPEAGGEREAGGAERPPPAIPDGVGTAPPVLAARGTPRPASEAKAIPSEAGEARPDEHVASGRVIDEQGGALQGVLVRLCDEEAVARSEIHTDSKGGYELPIRKSGPSFVLAEHPGVGMGATQRLPVSTDADVRYPDLVVRQGADVGGTLVDHQGRPLEGVPVQAISLASPSGRMDRWIDAPPGMDKGVALTDKDGRFRIGGLLAGRVTLWPGVSGSTGTMAETGPDEVRIVLGGHLVHLSVVDSVGSPSLSARWTLIEMTGGTTRRHDGVVGPTGGVGAFILVEEGAHIRVSATAPGCSPAELETRAADSDTTRVALRISCKEPAGRVLFEPTGAGASFVDSLQVSWAVASTAQEVAGPTPAGTLKDGYLIEAGRYRAEVRPKPKPRSGEADDFLPSTIEVTVASGAELRVPVPVVRGGRLQLSLTWPVGVTGGELESITLRSLGDAATPTGLVWGQYIELKTANGVESTSTTSTGGFTLVAGWPVQLMGRGLPPGRYEVEVKVEGYEPVTVETTVESGQRSDVAVRLEQKEK